MTKPLLPLSVRFPHLVPALLAALLAALAALATPADAKARPRICSGNICHKATCVVQEDPHPLMISTPRAVMVGGDGESSGPTCEVAPDDNPQPDLAGWKEFPCGLTYTDIDMSVRANLIVPPGVTDVQKVRENQVIQILYVPLHQQVHEGKWLVISIDVSKRPH